MEAVRAEIDRQAALGIREGDIPETDLDVVRREARRAYGEKAVNLLIRNKAGQYGGAAGFFEHEFAMNQIAELMGEDYLEELKKAYNIQDGDPAPKPEETPEALPMDEIPASAAELSSMSGEELLPPPLPVDPTTVPSLPEDKKRPGDPDAFITKPEQRKWDAKYGDRYNPDGSPIIVEARPPAGVEVTVRKGRRTVTTTTQKQWDAKYASTHNPDGSPKQFEDD
jgi:hypothetical protein